MNRDRVEEANEVSRRLNAFSAEVAAAVGILNAAEASLMALVAKAIAEGEMHMGPTLPAPLRRYLTCDCDIDVVWERDGRPLSTHAHDRTPPRRIRRLVMHRDKTCRVPGCTHHLWLQVHHIVHWEDHGETVTSNLARRQGAPQPA